MNSRDKHSGNSATPEVFAFIEADTNTFSYIVKDPDSNACAVVDSVLNLDYASGTISYHSADEIIDCIEAKGLQLELLIETHVHADHLSAAPYIQQKLGGKIAIGEQISEVQKVFATVFNTGAEFARDGSQFDILLSDKQHYKIGDLDCYVMHTPGHTPACMTHVIGDSAFVGDTLFMPDAGTARADFPGGDARVLFNSIQKILSLPEKTKLYMCHDYESDDREIEYLTTVVEQKSNNIHVSAGTKVDDFVQLREARDKTLGMPRLILPSLQVNMRAGHFPKAEQNEQVYLKIPIAGLKPSLVSDS